MPSVKIITLGCKLNQLESESFNEQLTINNEQFSDSKDDFNPSIIIVNTCTVTSKADQKARRVIRKALRDYPDATVIVTGCYAALEKEKIEELDSHKGTKAQRLLVLKREEVLNFLNNNSVKNSVSFDANFEFFPEKFLNHTRAFLKIQDGCDNHCTYCRIRLARGPSVSLPAEQILERLRILEQNHAEVVLTGVNISQYRDQGTGDRGQGEKKLFDLLDYLLSNTEKISLRLSSLDPQFIVDSLLTAHCSLLTDRVRPHFHLSIQSCSVKILQRMGRSYNAQTIENAVSLLRKAKDDPFLACDIITGFPGETEEVFNETFELCSRLRFAWIHVFPYSKRPGTVAASFKDTVQEREVTRRVKLLTDLAWQGRQEYVKRWVNREVDVVIQGKGKREEGTVSREQCAGADNVRPYTYGLSENYLKVLVRCDGDAPLPGAVIRCRLTDAGGDFQDFDIVGAPM